MAVVIHTSHCPRPGPFLLGQSRASRTCRGFVSAGHRGAALGRARAEEWVMRPPSTQLPCASPASSFIAPSPRRPTGAVVPQVGTHHIIKEKSVELGLLPLDGISDICKWPEWHILAVSRTDMYESGMNYLGKVQYWKASIQT